MGGFRRRPIQDSLVRIFTFHISNQRLLTACSSFSNFGGNLSLPYISSKPYKACLYNLPTSRAPLRAGLCLSRRRIPPLSPAQLPARGSPGAHPCCVDDSLGPSPIHAPWESEATAWRVLAAQYVVAAETDVYTRKGTWLLRTPGLTVLFTELVFCS